MSYHGEVVYEADGGVDVGIVNHEQGFLRDENQECQDEKPYHLLFTIYYLPFTINHLLFLSPPSGGARGGLLLFFRLQSK